jgi:hypothetical protein
MSPPLRHSPWHLWAGVAILIAAEAGVVAGNRTIATWLTPIAWTGYILVVDGLVRRACGGSWLTSHKREAPFLFLASIGIWLIFEAYNFHLQNWAYRAVPPNPLVRDFAYAWSFSTIAPAVFETADLVGLALWRRRPTDPADGGSASGGAGAWWILIGAALVAIPLALPTSIASYLFGAVWIGFIFLVDPINARLGAPSLAARWKGGDRSQVLSLLVAGGICGILWETWNYQAFRAGGAHWVYTIPEGLRVFGLHFGQMPVLGLLGFPPFALELYCLYTLLRTLLRIDRLSAARTR